MSEQQLMGVHENRSADAFAGREGVVRRGVFLFLARGCDESRDSGGSLLPEPYQYRHV